MDKTTLGMVFVAVILAMVAFLQGGLSHVGSFVNYFLPDVTENIREDVERLHLKRIAKGDCYCLKLSIFGSVFRDLRDFQVD